MNKLIKNTQITPPNNTRLHHSRVLYYKFKLDSSTTLITTTDVINNQPILQTFVNQTQVKLKKFSTSHANYFNKYLFFFFKFLPRTFHDYNYKRVFFFKFKKSKLFLNFVYFFFSKKIFFQLSSEQRNLKNIKFDVFKLPLQQFITSYWISVSKNFTNFNKSQLDLINLPKQLKYNLFSHIWNFLQQIFFTMKKYQHPDRSPLHLPTRFKFIPPISTFSSKMNLFYFKKFNFKYVYICANKLFLKFFLLNDFCSHSFKYLYKWLQTFYFYSFKKVLLYSNIYPNKFFHFHLTKYILKTFSYRKINSLPVTYYQNSLIRFIENCSGKKILIKIFHFINFVLSTEEYLRCFLWSQKLRHFQKFIGKGFFLFESIQILYITLKIKDPYLLINWLKTIFNKISFWKHRLFFHYLRYIFKYFFWAFFEELKIKGIKFQLKGKISVAGNARTRTVVYSIGSTSPSSFNLKILHSLELIKTFTGVMGLQVWMIF